GLILHVLMVLFTLHLLPGSPGAAGPQRIISLAPSLTQQLYDLGAEHVLIGVTRYRPESASSKDVIGTLTKLNLEKILSLQPDLILASKDSNRITDVERLTALGLRVSVFEGCESLACMCAEFVRLGELLGKRALAEDMVRLIRTELAQLQSSLSGRPVQRVYWQMGTDPLITASDLTFTGELIQLAGGKNIFADLQGTYPRVHSEEVIRRNPDVIILVANMDSLQEPSRWEGFTTISAVRHGRIHLLEADTVCQPTPAAFLRAYKAVLTILHPDLP
ncbi:MAG: helical backbone metal receptor, partial [Desulfomonilia bacterium]|nr:helical backbone metal receptor [Desulfomonilia bacterium]